MKLFLSITIILAHAALIIGVGSAHHDQPIKFKEESRSLNLTDYPLKNCTEPRGTLNLKLKAVENSTETKHVSGHLKIFIVRGYPRAVLLLCKPVGYKLVCRVIILELVVTYQ
eukprot:720332_1